MTAEEIIDKFEAMVDDTVDADLELQLVNDAMWEVEEDIKPIFIKKSDTTKSTTVGQTYTTAIDLPADFLLPEDQIFVGTEPYTQIPFDQAVYFRDEAGHFYIDHALQKYHLTGTQASVQTITFPYYYSTTELGLADSPVWPARFHSLIPLKMAQLFYALDGGDKQRSWDDRFAAQYQARLARLREYDAALKLAAQDNSAFVQGGVRESENRINFN